MPHDAIRESAIGRDEHRPFGESHGQIKRVIDCLIKLERKRLRSGGIIIGSK